MPGVDILDRIGARTELPSLPQVVSRVMQALDQDRTSADELAELLAEDPAITGRVMQMANSVVFTPSGTPAETVGQAVVRMGIREIRNIVLSVGVINSFDAEACPFDYLGFWKHSLTTAIAAGTVAAGSQLEGSRRKRQDNPYFAAGLLHDVGILLLAQSLGRKYQRVLEKTEGSGLPLHELEAEMLGYAHPEIAAALLRRWGVAKEAIFAAEFHHDPNRAPQQYRTHAQVVHLADWIAHYQGHGISVEGTLEHFRDGAWFDIGLEVEAIPSLIEEFKEAAKESDLLVTLASWKGTGDRYEA